jgi:hypothetical protein
MHDAKGRELKVGDRVVVPAVIVSVSPGDYCTLDVETLGVMPGNGYKNKIYALNTKQVYRVNDGDNFSINVEERDGKDYLV